MMQTIRIILVMALSLVMVPSQSQSGADEFSNNISFKVFGECIHCQQRIEAAAKKGGATSASWNMQNKILKVSYDGSDKMVESIKSAIVSVGHDLEDRKADDKVYASLPECCHYRKEPVSTEGETVSSNMLEGTVSGADANGKLIPLPHANITIAGTGNVVQTDGTGHFRIDVGSQGAMLIASYAGYNNDTLHVMGGGHANVILEQSFNLEGVVVRARQRSSYISNLGAMRTQIMTDKELLKAACCNLGESFETNPSVDVTYNDAVTGSKQIQLLGLSGNYTQLTVENLPGPRGLATPLGLNSISGPWIESIQLTKGIGSVVNGFESIAGQINIELKKPTGKERLFANMYVNDFGKTDLNLNLATRVGKKWSTGLLLHDDFILNRKLDQNKDGFRDLPTGNQFNFVNRWHYDGVKGLTSQFGIKFLNDERTGGQTNFDRKDKFTTNSYGIGINTRRYEAFGKIGYVFPGRPYKSIGLQLSGFTHDQDAFFGLNSYDGRQENLYLNLIYQSIIRTTMHKFRTGISFTRDKYEEQYKGIEYNRTEAVPGAFLEYTFSPSDNFNLVAGIRADHNSIFGFFATPRLHMRYEPVSGTTIRLSAGRGQRTANIFAENIGALASSRLIVINGQGYGKAYGLEPEVAWNKGISVDQKLRLFNRTATIGIDFFRNDFENQVVLDLEDPSLAAFSNPDGKSYSNSFQAELTMEPVKSLEARFAYRFFDVKSMYGGKLQQRPLISRHRAFANLAYSTGKWKFDYTMNYNGEKSIPFTGSNPQEYRRDANSPAFVLMNAQVSRTVGKKRPMDFYIGVENLTGFMQDDAIIAADDPFGQYFDASLVWAPVTGRMFYLGWRLSLSN